MVKFFSSFLIVTFLFSTSVDARKSPKRRNMGASLFQLQSTDAGLDLFNTVTSFGMQRPSWRILEDGGLHGFWDPKRMGIHLYLVNAWPIYNSWVLAQALVRYWAEEIIRAHGAQNMPEFLEVDQWGFVVAMQHWDQLGSPNQYDFERTYEEKWGRGGNADVIQWIEDIQASIVDFDEAWKLSVNQLLLKVDARRRALGYQSVRLKDFIENPDVNDAQRAAALDIQAHWRYAVDSERMKRGNFTPRVRP